MLPPPPFSWLNLQWDKWPKVRSHSKVSLWLLCFVVIVMYNSCDCFSCYTSECMWASVCVCMRLRVTATNGTFGWIELVILLRIILVREREGEKTLEWHLLFKFQMIITIFLLFYFRQWSTYLGKMYNSGACIQMCNISLDIYFQLVKCFVIKESVSLSGCSNQLMYLEELEWHCYSFCPFPLGYSFALWFVR